MGWARLDDGFHDHPKLIGLPMDAVGLYAVCLTWAHRHKGASAGLMGHIPPDLPTRLAGSKGKALAARLVTHQLWEVEEGLGGWVVHDFCDYLPAADRPQTADEVRAARSEAGRRGAASRWADKPKAGGSQTDGKLPSEVDGKPMPPTRPEPDPLQPTPPTSSGPPTTTARGNRLPEPFDVTDDLREWARTEAPHAGPRDHDAFCDHWRAQPGAKGRKVDWPATWRNWMRRASLEHQPRTNGHAVMPLDRAREVADLGARMQARADLAAIEGTRG